MLAASAAHPWHRLRVGLDHDWQSFHLNAFLIDRHADTIFGLVRESTRKHLHLKTHRFLAYAETLSKSPRIE